MVFGNDVPMLSAILRLFRSMSVRLGFTITLPTFYNKPMPPRYRYFTAKEVEGLDEEFAAKLDRARQASGIPYWITSGLRTIAKNESIIGSVPDSAHLRGLAVDLRANTSNEVCKIVQGLLSVGIHRIGIYVDRMFSPVHVHADVDPDKIPEVIFIKQEGA